jgi:two-component system response regulator AtoC
MSTDQHTPQQDARETAHILIGDDDDLIRDILRQDLEGNGYSIVEARTGPEALAALTREDPRPELALLDIRMPEIEGTDILQRMLEQGIDVPIILMTSYGSASMTIRAMQLGAGTTSRSPLTSTTCA